jgi:hypothetical protein
VITLHTFHAQTIRFSKVRFEWGVFGEEHRNKNGRDRHIQLTHIMKTTAVEISGKSLLFMMLVWYW